MATPETLEPPGVTVRQEFVTETPTVLRPVQQACPVGASHQIVEAVGDDGSLTAEALLAMPARLVSQWLTTPFEFVSLGTESLTLRVNNGQPKKITFTGTDVAVEIAAATITAEAIAGIVVSVEESGVQKRLVIETTSSGEQSIIKVDVESDVQALTALGMLAGATYIGRSGYSNWHKLSVPVTSYPDPRDNLDSLDIDYESVRVFINAGSGAVEATRDQTFLQGDTSAVTVVDDGDGDNRSSLLSFANADFDTQAASILGTVVLSTITYGVAGDFDPAVTLDLIVNGTPVSIPLNSGIADAAALVTAIDTALGADASAAVDDLDGLYLQITSDLEGASSSIEVVAPSLGAAVIGFPLGTYAAGAPAPARARGAVDISALTWASQVHDRTLRMSLNGGDFQSLSMPDTIAAAADVVTAIEGLWGDGAASLDADNRLILNALDTFGGVESVIRIDKVASDTTLLSALGLTGVGAPFASVSAVYGAPYQPEVGDEVWIDGVRRGTIVEIPTSPTSRLRMSEEQLLTFTGSTWYIIAKDLDGASASVQRPSADLIVDEDSGLVTVKHNIFRSTAGVVSDAPSKPTYLGYDSLRLDVTASMDGFSLIRITGTTQLEDDYGPIGLDNPLALGLYFCALNSAGLEVAGLGVDETSELAPEGTIEAYARAYEHLETQSVYALAPLTHDATVGQLTDAHVSLMSDGDSKGERIAFLNPERPSRNSDALVASGTEANVTGTPTDVIETGIANLQALLAAAGAPGPAYTIDDGVFVRFADDSNNYPVLSVSGSQLTTIPGPFVTGNDDGFYFDADGGDVFDEAVIDAPFSVFIRGDEVATLTEEAIAYADIGRSYQNRRIVVVAPDSARATLEGGLDQIVPGYYMCAALAGQRCSRPAQQPLSEEALTGFKGVIGSEERYGSKLNIIAAGGVWIMTTKGTGDSAVAITRHQLTTDVSTVERRELSITTALDFGAYIFRSSLRNFAGRYNITTSVEEAMNIVAQGLATMLVETLKVFAKMEIVSLGQSSTAADETELAVDIVPHYPNNKIRVTFRI